MRSILEEFALGNISLEPRFFKQNPECGEIMKKLSGSEEKLLSILDESEKEIFNEFISTQADLSRPSGTDKFVYGYRLGVLMTIEVFTGKEDLIIDGRAVE